MKVYVAGPYFSDPVKNTDRAIEVGNMVLEYGHVPYVPHLTHFWNRLHTEHPEETWLAMHLEWLESCDAVIRLPGASNGADAEVARAKELGLPVYTAPMFHDKYGQEF